LVSKGLIKEKGPKVIIVSGAEEIPDLRGEASRKNTSSEALMEAKISARRPSINLGAWEKLRKKGKKKSLAKKNTQQKRRKTLQEGKHRETAKKFLYEPADNQWEFRGKKNQRGGGGGGWIQGPQEKGKKQRN